MSQKPVLFTYARSIWASVPELAIRELEYAPGDISHAVMDLGRGENFASSFLDINPKGTLPTMTADGQVYTSTAEVTSYLVKHAPKPVKPGTSFIEMIHEDRVDPNFPLFLAVSVRHSGVEVCDDFYVQRSDQELLQKAPTAGTFIRDRQEALERYSSQPDAAKHKAFYDSRLARNGPLLSIYGGTASDHEKQAFFQQSTTHWNNLKRFITEDVPKMLPDTIFVGGDNPGEDDFHFGAWLARMVFIVGGGKDREGIHALEQGLGIKLDPKTCAYWGAWSSRKSWQEVYAQGLH